MSFAATFRRLVAPKLQAESYRLATELVADRLTFPEAMAELLAYAHRRGAGYLPEAIYDDLRDWLSRILLDDTELAEEATALVQRLLREPSREAMRKAVREFLDE
jgi:hypothetical protein